MVGGLQMSGLSVLFADDYESVEKSLSGFSKLEFTYRTCEKDGNVVLEELMKKAISMRWKLPMIITICRKPSRPTSVPAVPAL